MRFLLLLLLTSCVQGVPMPPRAPSFSPTLDAPITVGQPVYPGSPEELPRGTDRRVLPPNREPGIWASDREPKVPDTILGLPPVLPSSLSADVAGALMTCHARIAGALAKSDKREQAEQLTLGERRCLLPRLLVQCLEELQQEALTRYARASAAEAQQTALGERRLHCGDGPWKQTPTNTPAVQHLLADIAKHL